MTEHYRKLPMALGYMYNHIESNEYYKGQRRQVSEVVKIYPVATKLEQSIARYESVKKGH